MRFTDCSLPEIEFAVNGKRSVDSGVNLTVGDVLTCSAKRAHLYRWTNMHNSSDRKTHGNTFSISRPGSFSYECTVVIKNYCGTGMWCPFSRNISGTVVGTGGHLTFYSVYLTRATQVHSQTSFFKGGWTYCLLISK